MDANIQTDLAQLRISAQQREWGTSQDTLKRLLAHLDPLIAVSIAAPLLETFLPKFEVAYPQARWVRDVLLTVIVYGSASDDLPVNSIPQFPTAGCAHFLLGVFDLARSVQTQYTHFEKYSHITNTVANTILAHLQYDHFRYRPDSYATLRDELTPLEERERLQFNFWMDKHVADGDVAYWLDIANRLETALNNR
ncbi:MAG: hypothetical protein SH821_15930 [Phototrophicales bacterium]|nr:hypothetical protein [Phototrophicales bacterium]